LVDFLQHYPLLDAGKIRENLHFIGGFGQKIVLKAACDHGKCSERQQGTLETAETL
jgi:hypothetical protein